MVNKGQNNAPQKVYFFGPSWRGKRAYERWQMYDNAGYQVVGFVSTRRPQGDMCMGLPIVRPEEVAIDAVVVFCVPRKAVPGLYEQLWNHGVRKFYRDREVNANIVGTSFLLNECVTVGRCDAGTLVYAEMHVCDHCNLNCRGCTHYSPIFESVLPDLDKRLADISLLKEKVTNILVFRLMGGEPLLHPGLPSFVEKVRALLPETDLRLVTNGLLIPTASDQLLEAIARCDVAVDVSEYAPTHKIRDRIERKFSEFGIKYTITDWNRKQEFLIPLSLSGNSRYEHFCLSDDCVNLWEGKIARCPSVMYLERLNEVFDVHLPGEGVYQLSSCPNGAELIGLLEQPIPLCTHCVDHSVTWERCGKSITVEDFAVAD